VEACKSKLTELDKQEGIIDTVPKLDILINCAGRIFPGDLDNTFPQDHDLIMDLNLRTPFVLLNFFQDMLIRG
jgi:NAD(P)-dependent dehydrogenase (short-subunit alcohol dehydrogenase family)